MFKVVIIDDEPIIVQGLSSTIPWAEYDCKVVATANDGIEGSEIIKKLKPDIVFSDIAMPDLDGLSMIAGLKSEFPNMMICILTGYRNFDYAQKAIQLGVTRFLLKPSNMEEILEALSVMTETLKKNQLIFSSAGEITAAREPAHRLSEISVCEGPEENSESAASSFIVNNALKYMEANYSEKLSLSDVAEKTYVSQWHLSKLLNKHMGKNFSEILNSIRINHAKELLKNPSMRIGDIADAVGFMDLAHFSRVFKKLIGVSANEYRNTYLKGD